MAALMVYRLSIIICAIILLLVSACATGTLRDAGLDKLATSKASQALSAGIQNYEDGNYKTAAKNLQTALDSGLSFESDKVLAHKYLAFINCLSNREKQCRDEFRKALNIDTKFDLNDAEAGHPIWGPVFRSAKAERKK
jgi:Tfp pilus assembly protein PilF